MRSMYEELHLEFLKQRQRIAELEAENARLENAHRSADADAMNWKASCQEARAQRDRLEKALRPFAVHPGPDSVPDTFEANLCVFVGEIRAACAALSELKADDATE